MVAGVEPDEASLTVEDFHTLGWITAVLHEHSHAWTRPTGFSRFSWDWEHSLGDEPRWGRWQDADGVGRQENDLLDRAARLLQQRLTDYGSGPDRFGLVHADLRLANLLVDGSTITVIDFDDCGFGWFYYDFGTAVSFIEDDPAPWRVAGRLAHRIPQPPRDRRSRRGHAGRRSCCYAGCCCWHGWERTAIPRNPGPSRSPTPRAAARSPNAISVPTAIVWPDRKGHTHVHLTSRAIRHRHRRQQGHRPRNRHHVRRRGVNVLVTARSQAGARRHGGRPRRRSPGG